MTATGRMTRPSRGLPSPLLVSERLHGVSLHSFFHQIRHYRTAKTTKQAAFAVKHSTTTKARQIPVASPIPFIFLDAKPTPVSPSLRSESDYPFHHHHPKELQAPEGYNTPDVASAPASPPVLLTDRRTDKTPFSPNHTQTGETSRPFVCSSHGCIPPNRLAAAQLSLTLSRQIPGEIGRSCIRTKRQHPHQKRRNPQPQ